MARSFDTRKTLKRHRQNPHSVWCRSPGSGVRSTFPEDASNRIHHGYAVVQPSYTGARLVSDSQVFAMGSCFAREIEAHLVQRGGKVISVDDTIQRPEFTDETGRVRSGFFHRFTPLSMLQEFRAAFGELPGWQDDTLIYPRDDGVIDLNYTFIDTADASAAAVATRRSIAHALVRRAAEADVVILTLGLIEAWIHKATGFTANYVAPKLLVRNADEFEFQLVDFDETVVCLEEIRALLGRHNPKPVQLVVTVSPVPLSSTFTDKDIVIANGDSKSTLRAAAAAFCARHDDVHYFPSYEIVTNSAFSKAWRPDGLHVMQPMVRHVVDTFIRNYYEPGALLDAPVARPKALAAAAE